MILVVGAEGGDARPGNGKAGKPPNHEAKAFQVISDLYRVTSRVARFF
jgi:hypothetical protein